MTKHIPLKKILWIYILAFVLTAFSFNAKAQDSLDFDVDSTVGIFAHV